MKFNFIYVKNDVFRDDISKKTFTVDAKPSANVEGTGFLELLRSHKKDIVEKRFDNISSFNFNRAVFYKGHWTDISKIARGLFLNNNTGEIVARGFDKFFNYHEGMFNTAPWLKENLKFPVTVYKKYNGFFGVLGFDKENGKFLFCSKSCTAGQFPDYFKDIFYKLKENESQDYFQKLADYLVKNNSCFVFEVIDPVNDPHIVKYDKSDIVLLAEIKLSQKFEQTDYKSLCETGEEFGFKVKEKIAVFTEWTCLKSFLDEAEEYDYIKDEEGWVLEDSNNYHFKLKCGWYKFWKEMRYYKQKLAMGHPVSTSGLQTPLMNRVYAWMKAKSRDWLNEKSIIDIRDEFEKEYINEV